MTTSSLRRSLAAFAVFWALTGAVRGQITSNAGDGFLNAPYRGTITSLREACEDIPYGEVRPHCEPFSGAGLLSSSMITVESVGMLGWDRSVIRLFEGIDASGPEVDLSTGPKSISVLGQNFKRFSVKAIGTKTLTPQKFQVRFSYSTTTGGPTTDTQTWFVAPFTNSFLPSIGQSEAFLFGTPILSISAGAATLVVRTGQTAVMIGATFEVRDSPLGPSGVDGSTMATADVVFPGSAESVFLPNIVQFRLNESSYAKAAWGTPWPGHLIGFYNSGSSFGPDGTSLRIRAGSPANGVRHYDQLRPRGLAGIQAIVNFSNVGNLTLICDQATPTNHCITLTRTAGAVTGITTSDGRGWNIVPDGNGWITVINPVSGNGKRSFTYNSQGRVTRVSDDPNPLVPPMYEFIYAIDDDGNPTILKEEKRFVDNAMQTVVRHCVKLPAGSPPDPNCPTVTDSLEYRREYTGNGAEYRQFDFHYDSANNLEHRLVSITSYDDVNAGGTPHTTTYTHDENNASGSMAITRVDLPDGTRIEHEYDSHICTQPVSPSCPDEAALDFGFRTKSTRSRPGANPPNILTTLDVDYEFFYTGSGQIRLFYQPRIVKQRDGRGPLSEVTFDYENGFNDENLDDCEGQVCNQLLKRTGPTIALGTSGIRMLETRFTYDGNRMLMREEMDFASGMHRATELGYDSILRLTTQTADPSGENILTRFLYCDTAATQDRITVDPDGYWSRTRFDNDGRVTSTEQFLVARVGDPGAFNAGCTQPLDSPPPAVYKTTNSYNTHGFLEQQIIENKDQDGNSLAPDITTTFSPDRLGRVTLQTVDSGGIGQEFNFNYNWLGEIERQFDTLGRGTKHTYDGRGLVISEIPLAEVEVPVTNLITTFTYDAMGNLQLTNPPTRPAGSQEERTYDHFNRLEKIIRHPGTDGGNTITTTFTYDAANNITRTVVEEGTPTVVLSDSTAQFDEGSFNFRSRQRAASGVDDDTKDAVTERKFDWAGNVTEEKSLGDATVADRIITTVYDGANRVGEVSDNLGSETIFTRDDRGNVTEQSVKIDESNSAVTSTVYDALSRAIQITSPEDGIGGRPDRIRRYDSRGNLLHESLRDAVGAAKLTTVFAYDNAGRQTRQAILANAGAPTTAADASKATDRVVDSEYDADGRLRFRHTYNNGTSAQLTTETTYDDLGRIDRVTDPSGSYTDEDYTTNGRLSQRVISDGVGTRTFTFGYDGHDRVKEQTALGSPNLVTMFTLDGLDQQTRITDPRGIVTRTEFDLVGRRKALVEDDSGDLQRQTDFGYNRLSQLITQTAKNKTSTGTPLADQLTTYRYDSLGRQTRIVYPDALPAQHDDPTNCTDCVRQTFDLAGRMTQRLDQLAVHTTNLTYDDRGLVLSRTTGTDQDTFEYDAVGRLTKADRGTTSDLDAVSHSEMAYTDLGDLGSEIQAIPGNSPTPRTVAYLYDQAGNRKQLTFPGGEVLAYTPTSLNQVDTVSLNGDSFIDYDYKGRLLDKRRTITTPGGTTAYEYDVGYDSYGRINSIANSFQPSGGNPQTVVAYAFTHDKNGNPRTQTATVGLADFVADDREFIVDRLNRLTGTEYFENGQVESTIFDLVGNRESHTNRAGMVTAYETVNEANEYATIQTPPALPVPVTYDTAGNLKVDQAGRQYFYDEHNRLKQIKNSGNDVLADYTYDALGRRIVSTIGGATTRYYYDGQSVIEERDASDLRLRYQVNGSQFIDERVATFTASAPGESTGTFTYYLGSNNYSVVGTGNADGSSVTRLDYSPTGDFAGGGPGASDFYHDADNDGDIDLHDLAIFQRCFKPSGAAPAGCLPVHDFDTAGLADGHIDLNDYARFFECFRGPFFTPDQVCAIPPNTAGLLVSGAFTLHGRPADVLSDGHTLLDFRARSYDPVLGRWLQRDPLPYNDGFNLYEPFRGNSLSNSDPSGQGILTWLLVGRYDLSDWDFIRQGGLGQAAIGFGTGRAEASVNVVIGAAKGARELGYIVADVAVTPIDVGGALIFDRPVGKPFSEFFRASEHADLGEFIVATAPRNVANAVTFGGYNVVEGTVIYVQTADAKTFSQNVGGQGLLTLGTVGAVRGVTAGRAPTLATVRAQQLRVNVARGELGEINALALQRSLGETIVRTQFPQGAALRGFESVSAVETAQGLRVFVNEVKASPGNIVPGRFSAFGLNNPATFRLNLLRAQGAVAAQVTDPLIRSAIQTALEERTFSVRIIGPLGIRISPTTQLRIQAATGAHVEVLDLLVLP